MMSEEPSTLEADPEKDLSTVKDYEVNPKSTSTFGRLGEKLRRWGVESRGTLDL